MAWRDGYITDIAYTTGFYRELAPGFLNFVAALQGMAAPDPAQPFRYAELGCGQGFGTNILAAAYPHGQFTGIDFNPAQIANAREMATQADLPNVAFREESFAQAAEVDDATLPPVDFIALHGIYSWISRDNQNAIRRFIDRKLRPGGLVYISYNCQPGWAAMGPVQRLLHEHARRHPGRSDTQMDGALDFAMKLSEKDLGYFTQNPTVPKRLAGMEDKATAYLAHEYLNDAWTPLYITDVAADMAEAKLDYLGSASLLENFASLALPPKAREMVQAEPDPLFRELLKDYAVNKAFRRDVYVKGGRALSEPRKRERLAALGFAPLKPHTDMSFKFQTPLGEATGQESVYAPIADAVAGGAESGTAPGADFAAIVRAIGGDSAKALQALAALTFSGQIHPTLPPVDPAPARRLNEAVAERALAGEAYRYLAAPGIGNGIAANDVDSVALSVLMDGGVASARDLAAGVWARFSGGGRRMVRDGKAVDSDAENVAELEGRVAPVLANSVPLWRTLGLLPAS